MVFQVKSSKSDTGFKPDDIDKCAHFADDLLNMTGTPSKPLALRYNVHLATITEAFKQTYIASAKNFPSSMEFYYIPRGDGDELNVAGEAAKERLIATVRKHRGSENSSDHIELFTMGSPALLAHVRMRRQRTRRLNWTQQPIPIGKGYLGMVKLKDYFGFLKDENGDLDELIFESNVRGNQGRTSVNRQMKSCS